MKKGIKLMLLASGSGTDADSIMKAWKTGYIPEVTDIILMSTKEGAGCIEKAEILGVEWGLIPCKGPKDIELWNDTLAMLVESQKIDLIFLVGCIHKVYPIDGVPIYNIHPADPKNHGGKEMYGLSVHLHVLGEIYDFILRGRGKAEDKFFTYPTVHEADWEYDSGVILLQQTVEIPGDIVKGAVQYGRSAYENGEEIETLAKKLQQHVLPYEHLMLPGAVCMAVQKIIDGRKGG